MTLYRGFQHGCLAVTPGSGSSPLPSPTLGFVFPFPGHRFPIRYASWPPPALEGSQQLGRKNPDVATGRVGARNKVTRASEE